MTMIKPIILFDLDGTLIDSTKSILNGFHSAFNFYKLSDPSDEKIASFIGYPLEIMFANLGAPKELNSALVIKYKEIYKATFLDDAKLLPLAKQAIISASKFSDLGVVTTKTSKYSTQMLEFLGVMEYFSVLIGRDDVQNPKPSPEPVLKALNILNRDKEYAFMIGDTILDANSAKSAGIAALGVSCGYSSETDLLSCCDKVFANAYEAVEFIKATTK